MSITFHGKARDVATTILEAFQHPEQLPAALAPIFIHRKSPIPSAGWSWSNRLLVSLRGHADARGFRQWQEVNRAVRKGERAIYILAPITCRVPDDESGEPKHVIVGFRTTPVFGLSQTEGAPVSSGDPAVDAWLSDLPFRAIAAAWNIEIDTFGAASHGPRGSFSPGQISLGVQNLSVWCHELVHAADHRNGSLTELGQHWRSETVAELGAAVLLKLTGRDAEVDLGGCWRYIAAYAKAEDINPVTACQRVLTRTCDAVALILDTAERLRRPDSSPAATTSAAAALSPSPHAHAIAASA